MKTNINPIKLARQNVQKLKPYTSARSTFIGSNKILLDANENPFGKPELTRYPDPLQQKLRIAIGKINNVDPENIIFGNGSDECIDLVYRIFCEPQKDSVIICPPTFGMFRAGADINDINKIEIPLDKNFDLDLESIRKNYNKAKLLFICSPNNPTGNLMSQDKIETVLNEFPGIVVIDEAYIQFTNQPSWNKRVNEFPNLIVLQTFSKYLAMAGCRLGMAFANKDIIELFQRVKPPYNVGNLPVKKAFECLNDLSIWEEKKNILLNERKRLKKYLNTYNFVEKIYPSDANFLLLKVNDGQKLYDYLFENNIVIRKYSDPRLDNFVRITIGTPEENKKLITTIQKFTT